MKLNVTYMSGAGNLFTVIDNRDNKIDLESASMLAKTLCSINEFNSLETEGLMLLDNSNEHHFKCDFFNPDGSTGMMCGNGGRAIVHFALNENAIDRKENQYNFEMAGRIYSASLKDDLIDLEMPAVVDSKELTVPIENFEIKGYYIDVGTEHFVINIRNLNIESLDELNIEKLGSLIRNHEIFQPVGANANFYEVTGKDSLKLRTYERGVEKETGACGTGAVATAFTSVINGESNFPVSIIPTSGEQLTIDIEGSLEKVKKVHLIGPAKIISTKEIEIKV